MDLIDLGIGQPDLAILPLSEMLQAAQDRLSTEDTRLLQYGPEQGNFRFRESLARFITEHHGAAVAPEELFVSAGASHGLDIVCSRFTRPGETVFVEEPTYFHALRILKARHLRLVPIPVDAGGIDLDALEERLKEEVPKLLYFIPTHHNPATVTLDVQRRQRLAALAERFSFWLVADEVYQMLSFAGDPPPPMATFSKSRVLSLGSFSKILGPGLRLGWVQGEPEQAKELAQCGVRKSGGGVSPFTSAIVKSAIDLGLQAEYVRTVRQIYQERARFFYDKLRALLPQTVRFEAPKGGFFLWLELPKGEDAAKLVEEARAAGVAYRAGPLFSTTNGLSRYLRVSFTYYPKERLEQAAERLAKVLNNRIDG